MKFTSTLISIILDIFSLIFCLVGILKGESTFAIQISSLISIIILVNLVTICSWLDDE